MEETGENRLEIDTNMYTEIESERLKRRVGPQFIFCHNERKQRTSFWRDFPRHTLRSSSSPLWVISSVRMSAESHTL